MTIRQSMFSFFLIAGLLLTGAAPAGDLNENIVVSNAWVRAMPPSMNNTAAYMTIENRTGGDIVLQSAGTSIARTVEIHRMEMAGDTMVMKKVDSLRIGVGERFFLKPNGFHIMMINLLRPLEEGETIPIVLYFEGGRRVTVKAVVRKWGERE